MANWGKRKDGQAYPKTKKKGTKRKGAIKSSGTKLKTRKSIPTTWEDYAIKDGLLRKDGMLNIAGKKMMEDLLNSPSMGSYENGYGSFLEGRLDD